MKSGTHLDYAEFCLTHSSSRCELYISADGVKEKLATGYFKPFLAHLQIAELQVGRGQVIRLDSPAGQMKKNKASWFTKGTLERFVRFVSTPEVLEQLKNIEDELSQLEHVRVSLSKTFSKIEGPLQMIDTTSSPTGAEETSMSMMKRYSVDGEDSGAEASKIELLRAMDFRLIALKQEQTLAFSRAMAAGFDQCSVVELLEFAEHFGADCLRNACVQFVAVCKKRKIGQEEYEELEFMSADAASSGSDMSLESGTDPELASETEATVLMQAKQAWPKAHKSNLVDTEGKFCGQSSMPGAKEEAMVSASRTSIRTRSRWGPPERIQIPCLNSEVSSLQDTEISKDDNQVGECSLQHDIRHKQSGSRPMHVDGGDSPSPHLMKQPSLSQKNSVDPSIVSLSSSKSKKELGDRQGEGVAKGSMFFARLQKMAQQVEARRSCENLGVPFTSVEMSEELSSPQQTSAAIDKSSSIVTPVLNPAVRSMPSFTVHEKGASKPEEGRNVSLGSVPASMGVEGGPERSTDHFEKALPEIDAQQPTNTSARRLSVQAAISLFESKKESVGEPPTRKLTKQDSKKALIQGGNSSTSEKVVLRRWSATQSDSPKETQCKVLITGLDCLSDAIKVEPKAEEKISSRSDCLNSDEHALPGTDRIPFHSRPMFQGPAIKASEAGRALPMHCSTVQPQHVVANPSSQSDEGVVKNPKQQTKESLLKDDSRKVVESDPFPTSSTMADQVKISAANTTRRQQTEIKGQGFGQQTLTEGTKDKGWASANNISRTTREQQILAVKSKDRGWTSANNMVPDVKRDVDVGKMCIEEEQRVKLLPEGRGKEKGGAFNQGIPIQDPPAVKKLEGGNPKQETNQSIQSVPHLSRANVCETQQSPDKEPASILHATPVDLYMQALVMMIDKNQQTSLNLGVDEELSKEQRGKFYEQYRRLRSARQKGEHPARRAEREAKLCSMMETLQRKKAEMDAEVSKHRKLNSRSFKEQMRVGNQQLQKQGLLRTAIKQEGVGEEVEVGLQDWPSSATSPAAKQQVVIPRANQDAKKMGPNLQKSASAARITVVSSSSSSSPKAIPKDLRGAETMGSQQKPVASSYGGTMENFMNRTMSTSMDSKREMSRLLACAGVSLETHEKMSGSSRDAAAVHDDGDKMAAGMDGVLADEGLSGWEWSTRVETTNAQSLNHMVDHGNASGLFASADSRFLQQQDNLTPQVDGESLDLLDVDAMGNGVEENASNDEKIVFIDGVDRGKHETHFFKDLMSTSRSTERDGNVRSVVPSSEKTACEFLQSNSNSPTSIIQGYTTSANSDAAASPANSCEGQTGITSSPKLAMPSDSPSASAASWNSFKMKHPSEADLSHSQRQLSSCPPPKLVTTMSHKEAVRGFKRLLHFGRKSRAASEAASNDCLSVSTTSEGDDDVEETRELMRQTSDELFRRAKLNEKWSSVGDSDGPQGRGTTHSLRSSIPTPPTNFKLRDDHLSGGTSLKAPRSFFSLPSFRNRGSDGKSR